MISMYSLVRSAVLFTLTPWLGSIFRRPPAPIPSNLNLPSVVSFRVMTDMAKSVGVRV